MEYNFLSGMSLWKNSLLSMMFSSAEAFFFLHSDSRLLYFKVVVLVIL